jgi:hypothetical protein
MVIGAMRMLSPNSLGRTILQLSPLVPRCVETEAENLMGNQKTDNENENGQKDMQNQQDRQQQQSSQDKKQSGDTANRDDAGEKDKTGGGMPEENKDK